MQRRATMKKVKADLQAEHKTKISSLKDAGRN